MDLGEARVIALEQAVHRAEAMIRIGVPTGPETIVKDAEVFTGFLLSIPPSREARGLPAAEEHPTARPVETPAQRVLRVTEDIVEAGVEHICRQPGFPTDSVSVQELRDFLMTLIAELARADQGGVLFK